ncbi:glycogen/starch/alpha-glucan phosphorylase [Cereibacter azotoformans]|uniref:Alpha-1,4 glucan phosphorylase n=1 Tax=Cereibacter azotoformans TaxID=43057 RepID=A0A2T5K992_9RHOB|nr:glycogen/starch/alpha-glucan phosphorylase [Cereibacter azotoformans]AXQ93283.1 glycogen/starch/alpha-glucan phosphorylase [Cereibacter sphaeroides]MBO4169057.1 glycogen/starch/alpha-glucan phosphorylase [Cereibacter azotoformans]PTR18991.1 starch phosphorylase [Cereibacter azotoformans]UIJ31596.1 glycogen/starch/alpha-glucan phosphorylase [Cereibacter azotoformans]
MPVNDQSLTPNVLKTDVLRHLTFTLGKDAPHASLYDWRMALSYAIRDRIMEPWFASTRRTWEEDRKRVYYLSMEFLIGRILEDATINLGLHDMAERAMADLGQDFKAIVGDEPDAALGNGGLGRLAACFMESMATLGCPAYGYGIRYEHGLFRQRFEGGQQVETPEDWLTQRNPWEFDRPEATYIVGFKGHVETREGREVWVPGETVKASAHDTPVVGWKGRWANTLRLWGATPTTLFDLERFNRGDYTAAAEPETLARTLSRVLYPDDTTYQGKELRLKQEFFLTSAALQDILRRFKTAHGDLRALSKHVAIQMNDTHPAIAGPELIRQLVDENGIPFDEALPIAQACLGYTNHTLLPEALERWATFTFGNVLPRHMQIVERIDGWHRRTYPARPHYVGIVKHHEVRMGELAFIMAHKVNGVSALHSDLVKTNLFPELNRLHPEKIVNQTNGVTPRRWLKMANAPLARLIGATIGEGWEDDLDGLKGLEPHVKDRGFLGAFDAAKRQNKVALSNWMAAECGVKVSPDALFDVQVKRIHEYKRQLLNILETVARWQAIRANPNAGWVPRVKIFGGKSAPGYAVAKEIIHLINDVGAVINSDPVVGDLLKVVYPANYNVSMAERLVPAADLSEQISTAGKEASGTGNMKFMMNGAPTIGTLDGANVEILQEVGAENFFLFGLTAEEVMKRREDPDHARKAIEASRVLPNVLQAIAEGQFSPSQPDRYHGLVHRVWHHDYFLVSSDFDAYLAAQAEVDVAYADRNRWLTMAALNTARSGFFSSDRTIRGYMKDIWGVESALQQ